MKCINNVGMQKVLTGTKKKELFILTELES